MTLTVEAAPKASGVQLDDIAARLMEIASSVAAEAERATLIVRGLTCHTDRIAKLAAGLEREAAIVEASVTKQAEALSAARADLAGNEPTIDALRHSASTVAGISASIATIAEESRILSINARIEAARASGESRAFAVVAAEMSKLSARTVEATNDIGKRTDAIASNISAADAIVSSYKSQMMERGKLLQVSVEHAGHQRETAKHLATLTIETTDTVEDAAAAIGRVGSNAIAVKMLAREVSKIACTPR